MYASVRLSAVQSPTVLVVPETAITYTAYGQTVFIASADPAGALSVRRAQVTTGERWQGQVEITSGLALGELELLPHPLITILGHHSQLVRTTL